MAMMTRRTARCAHCGANIDETLDPPGGRWPCPDCGSSGRALSVSVSESVTLRDGLGFVQRRPGFKKPIAEGFVKPTVSMSTGRAVEHSRMIDRGADRYFERVTECESGHVVHQTDERLTDHRGHGSAKFKGRSK